MLARAPIDVPRPKAIAPVPTARLRVAMVEEVVTFAIVRSADTGIADKLVPALGWAACCVDFTASIDDLTIDATRRRGRRRERETTGRPVTLAITPIPTARLRVAPVLTDTIAKGFDIGYI